jgi:GTPase SAR1 family protein
MTERRPIVVGGPNGSGKSTFAEAYVARHFWRLYRPLADEWQLIGNTGESFETWAIGQGDDLVANDPVRLAQFLKDIGEPE